MYYNYENGMKGDITNFLEENFMIFPSFDDRDDMVNYLEDKLWDLDSVTGNGSGSYFYNRSKAAEAITHNLDVYVEAINAFGIDELEEKLFEPEFIDVTIRCYLLNRILWKMANDGILDKYFKFLSEVEED